MQLYVTDILSPLQKVHYDYTSMSCKKKMFIQYYVSQCCKILIAMSTVRGEGVYIDDSFIVDIVSSLFRHKICSPYYTPHMRLTFSSQL